LCKKSFVPNIILAAKNTDLVYRKNIKLPYIGY
jgi:hypothetical protein